MRGLRLSLFGAAIAGLLLSLSFFYSSPVEAPGEPQRESAEASPTGGPDTEKGSPLPPGATESWWSDVQEYIRKDQLRVRGDDAAGFSLGAVSCQARFSADEVTLTSTNEDDSWRIGWGHAVLVGGENQTISLVAEENVLTVRNGSLVEQWENRVDGLEHTIVLEEQLKRNDVRVRLALETALTPRSIGSDQVMFSQGSRDLLCYQDLYVFDADQKPLPAEMAVVGSSIEFRVDARGAAWPITIDPLLTTPDWNSVGDNVVNANFSYALAGAGDVNGDGYDDILVAAPYQVSGGNSNAGKIFLYYGSTSGPSTSADWTSVGDDVASAYFGQTVAGIGDVNGDGYDDFAAGAWIFDLPATDVGKVWVFYGSSVGPAGSADWTSQGDTVSAARFGRGLAGAGDVNNDGYDDLVVGAPYDTSQDGKVFIFHGSSSGLSTSADTSILGQSGKGGRFGYFVGGGGDVNGDGYDDIVVGAPRYDINISLFDVGKAYLYSGSSSGVATTASWTDTGSDSTQAYFGETGCSSADVNGDGYADLVISAHGEDVPNVDAGTVYAYLGGTSGPSISPDWTAHGEGASSSVFGQAISDAGDVNGDGFSDIVIGAYGFDIGGGNEGKAYLYLGALDGLQNYPEFSAVGDQYSGGWFGYSVAGAGDVDGDGYDDILIGAYPWDGTASNSGKAYLYYGGGSGADWTSCGDAQTGSRFGYNIGGGGDVNGDGYDDVLVGAQFYTDTQTSQGKAYLFLGSMKGLHSVPAWTSFGEAQAHSYFGSDVAICGDVNDDGFDDLLVAAHSFSSANSNAGKVYLYYGGSAGPSTSPDWTSLGDDSAGAFFGVSLAAAGDVNGDLVDDFVIGAFGFGASTTGKAYLWFGNSGGPATPPDWTSTGDAATSAYFGSVVTGIGDVDNDGYDDIAVSAPRQGDGVVFAFHGSASGPSTGADWAFSSSSGAIRFGSSLDGGGDVNGDGYSDFIVGSPFHSQTQVNGGEALLFLGSASGLSGAADWSSEGDASFAAEFGHSVAIVGDLNGDGYDDIAVGARGQAGTLGSEAGKAFVYLGSAGGPSTSPVWESTGDDVAGANFGYAVAGAGDVDGDGLADFLVSAPFFPVLATGAGKTYLFRGRDLSLFWYSVGDEQSNSEFAYTLSGGKDVNQDGYDDVLISAYRYNRATTDTGKVYLYAGTMYGPSTVPVWTATGPSGAHFGYHIALCSDLNGDGFDDVLVGAPFSDAGAANGGEVFAYFGGSTGPSLAPDWTSTGDSENSAYFGRAVAEAGDVNGDGYGDLLVGANQADSLSNTDTGKVFLFYGSAGGPGVVVDWTSHGEDVGSSYFGDSLVGGCDFNNDGYDDFAVAATGFTGSASFQGKVYAFYGSPIGPAPVPDWSVLGPAQSSTFFGVGLGCADVNGDGYDDLIAGSGSISTTVTNCGEARVYEGGASGLQAQIWSSNGDEFGGAFFGEAVAGAGDVNGDGFEDILIGARYQNVGLSSSAGKAFIFPGSASGPQSSALWTSSGNEVGYAEFGHAVSGAGDINGDGHDDWLIGAHFEGGDVSYTGAAYAFSGGGLPSGAGGGSGDSTPPIAGTVNDGTSSDIDYQGSTTTIEANWSGFSDPESGISWYDWAIGTTPGGTDVQSYTYASTSTSGTASGLTLTPGTTYYVTVKAWNGVEDSVTATSDGVTVDTSNPVAGVVNDGLSTDIDESNDPTRADANWSGFTDPESGITEYQVALGTSPGSQDVFGFYNNGTGTSITLSFSSTPLSEGVTYYWTVVAYNGAGQNVSVSSNGFLVNASAPTAGTVDDGWSGDEDYQSHTVIFAAWTGFSDPQGIAYYEWAIGTSSGATDVQSFVGRGQSTSASNSGLTLVEGTTYYATVRAYDSGGLYGEASSDGVTVDLTPPVCGSVSDGASTDVDIQGSTTTIEANWTGFSDGETAILRYEWAIGSSISTQDIQAWTSVGTATSASNSGLSLQDGSTYYVFVRATDMALNTCSGAMSDGVTVDVASAVPGAVSNLQAVAGDQQISLTWSAATNATSYLVYYGTATGVYDGSGSPISASGTSYTLTGLSNRTRYYIVVSAVSSAAVEGSPSSEVNSTPLQTGPETDWHHLSGGTGVEDYQMVGFSVTGDSQEVSDALRSALGPYDPMNWRMFRWDPYHQQYVELDAASSSLPFHVEPGIGYFLLTRNPVALQVPGTLLNPSSPFQATLVPGWNLVGNPWPFAVSLDNCTVDNVQMTSSSNGSTQPYVWYFYRHYASTTWFEAGEACWVYNSSSSPVTLEIAAEPLVGASRGSGSTSYKSGDARPPALPGKSSDGGSGGGGCLVGSANHAPAAAAFLLLLLGVAILIRRLK